MIKKNRKSYKKQKSKKKKKKKTCYYGLGEKPNNKKFIESIISPPVKLSIDPYSLLSNSVYKEHSVLVMNDCSLKGIGNNSGSRISHALQKTFIQDFTNFFNQRWEQLLAHCDFGTLYIFSKSSGNEKQLVLCDLTIKEGDTVFLGIGNHQPASLFLGFSDSASIGSEGEVIFINCYSVIGSPNSPIAAVSLPEGEKASSVTFFDSSI